MVKAGALRKRYILFEFRGPEMGEDGMKQGIYAEALRFFGEYGLSEIALKLVSYDKATKTGILRCQRDYLEKVLGFLALVDSIDSKPARTIAKKSSGTIKSLQDTRSK
jgi:ribonuclease P/MRP protein subunit POP5